MRGEGRKGEERGGEERRENEWKVRRVRGGGRGGDGSGAGGEDDERRGGGGEEGTNSCDVKGIIRRPASTGGWRRGVGHSIKINWGAGKKTKKNTQYHWSCTLM